MSRSPPELASNQATEDDIEQFLADQRAAEQHQQQQQQYQQTQPNIKSTPTAPPQKNVYQQSTAPQRGKVVSITRTDVFGSTRTNMKVLMDKGGERTINADGTNIKVGMDIETGDSVLLKATGHMSMEWSKIVPVTEKVRRKRKVFDMDILFSEDGLPKLHQSFPLIHWDTRKDCETKVLTQMVSMYKNWLFHLWPKMNFIALVERLEKMGSKSEVKRILNDMRYGTEVDWSAHELDEEGKTKKKVALNPAAEELFNAYAAALQPGIKKAKGTEEEEEEGPAADFDDDDALFAALAEKYSTNPSSNGATANGSDPVAGGSSTTTTNVHALLARKKAADAERARKDAEEQLEMEARYAEEAELDVFARAANVFTTSTIINGHKTKKRRVVEDDEESADEAEADLAPLTTQAATAAANTSESAPAESESATGVDSTATTSMLDIDPTASHDAAGVADDGEEVLEDEPPNEADLMLEPTTTITNGNDHNSANKAADNTHTAAADDNVNTDHATMESIVIQPTDTQSIESNMHDAAPSQPSSSQPPSSSPPPPAPSSSAAPSVAPTPAAPLDVVDDDADGEAVDDDDGGMLVPMEEFLADEAHTTHDDKQQ